MMLAMVESLELRLAFYDSQNYYFYFIDRRIPLKIDIYPCCFDTI